MDNLTDIQLADLLGVDEQTAQTRAAALSAALRKQQARGQDQQAMAGLMGYFNAPGADAMGKAYGAIGAQQFESAQGQLEQIPKATEQRLQRALEAQKNAQQVRYQDATLAGQGRELDLREKGQRSDAYFKQQQLEQGKYGVVAPGGTTFNTRTGEMGSTSPVEKAPTGVDPVFKNTGFLRKEFAGLPEVKTYKEITDALGKVGSEQAQPTAAADMSLVFAYMKMLDPGSAVKEGEYASAKNTTGVPDQILNAYNKAKDGTFLDAQQRANFRAEAQRLFGVHRTAHGKAVKQYRTLAEKNGLAPDDVTGALEETPAGGGREAKLKRLQQLREQMASEVPK